MNPVLIKEAMPFSDKSANGVLDLVKSIIEQPGVVRFEMDSRMSNVHLWRAVSPEEASERAISFRDALRQVDMEEYDPHDPQEDVEKTSYQQLFEMFEMIEDAGCVPTHVLIGSSIVQFRDWLPLSRKAKAVYGVPLVQEDSLEQDVLIVCGAEDWNATAADVKYAVKVTL